ncbi:putative SnoaL-like aldol condensation-catalyzing enzyme [Actinomadura pelletieri DSM 43383]|uniref:Putative SnoaL-like aldol condensation-catalyzing enzyme n=1 Tax=Actinomadura pelletieri DSM 43383 TaxID=1120940 RepID=A0A495R0N8_9ACTN|nr:nuclear transport factor 2 family protein [Actinomadura pelletieri]RKS79676.1 putative SnoaL-like aldol condensation-catalyzing enzyme [Actinomadura pelletieri DSM 43383]
MSTDKKELIQRALSKLLETGDAEALAPALSDDFLHHRPDGLTRTKTEWLAAIRASWENIADMKVEINHILADGDHVVLHTRRTLPDDGPQVTVVDILRLDNDLIAEAWETIEPSAQAPANLEWWEPTH